MKKPKTLKELYNLVNPEDLLEVLDFCGINSNWDKVHNDLRKKFDRKIWKSIKNMNRKEPINYKIEIKDEHYETIIKCIQDFYWWSHQFNHSSAHIYKRVMNALDIPMKKIIPIMEKIKK